MVAKRMKLWGCTFRVSCISPLNNFYRPKTALIRPSQRCVSLLIVATNYVQNLYTNPIQTIEHNSIKLVSRTLRQRNHECDVLIIDITFGKEYISNECLRSQPLGETYWKRQNYFSLHYS